jgi:UDP-N-acetyl-2-amino-2-deoxyglucuronate dehydrogenase
MRFGIIGCAGYIAEKHLQAIQAVGGELVTAYDIADSVGRLDKYSKDIEFFTNEWEFKNFLSSQKLDFISICSPNYLHQQHCTLAVNHGANVICEKPIAMDGVQLEELMRMESLYDKKIFGVLQMRLHPAVSQIKSLMCGYNHVKFTYLTPRGKWYHRSWKGNMEKSGGTLLNIGIHIIDFMIYLFGKQTKLDVEKVDVVGMSYNIHLENKSSDIHINLSINPELSPQRVMALNGQSIQMTEGFNNLHTAVYRDIIGGGGVRPFDVRDSMMVIDKLKEQLR